MGSYELTVGEATFNLLAINDFYKVIHKPLVE
jgi:hypothetical protein